MTLLPWWWLRFHSCSTLSPSLPHPWRSIYPWSIGIHLAASSHGPGSASYWHFLERVCKLQPGYYFFQIWGCRLDEWWRIRRFQVSGVRVKRHGAESKGQGAESKGLMVARRFCGWWKWGACRNMNYEWGMMIDDWRMASDEGKEGVRFQVSGKGDVRYWNLTPLAQT